MIIADNVKLTAVAVPGLAASGPIGTAAATVDLSSLLLLNLHRC